MLMIVLGSASAGCFIGIIIAAAVGAGATSDAIDAHRRVSDALATLRARVDSALAAETPSAAPAAKRICRILRGEE